jgi:ribosome-associated protein
MEINPEYLKLCRELNYKTSRSSGPGGQNVNKVNSRVELRFRIGLSLLLSDEEKATLFEKLKNRLTNDGELILVSQTERSQLKNKENVTHRFNILIEKALRPGKKRLATKPTLKARLKRLEGKKYHSRIKEERKKPEF